MRRPPFSRLHPIAIIEDEDSIQASLMEVINGLVRNTLDVKRAALILRALHIAVKNAGRVRLDSQVEKKVREIPEYALPPEEVLDPIRNEGGRAVLDEEAELPAVAAKEPSPVDPQQPHWNEVFENGGRVLARRAAATSGAENVVTAQVRPDRAATAVSANTARLTPSLGRTKASAPPQPVSAQTQRKPPANVKVTQNAAASQQRKNAPQPASAG